MAASSSVAFSMLIEVIRLKLPAKLKNRFNQDFNTLLAAPADGATAAAIAQTAASHRAAGVTYRGQKTHEKKVLNYLQKAQKVQWTEEQLDTVCKALFDLKAQRMLHGFAELGQGRFPNNPYFPFWEVQAHMLLGPFRSNPQRIHLLLEQVRRLAADMPPDSRKQGLLEVVQRCEEMVAVVSPFGGLNFDMFQDMLDNMFGGGEDEDEDDDF